MAGTVISQLHVLCRLRGDAPELQTTGALEEYLEGECAGLLTALRDEWWEGGVYEGEGARVRAPYTADSHGRWLKGE